MKFVIMNRLGRPLSGHVAKPCGSGALLTSLDQAAANTAFLMESDNAIERKNSFG